MPGEIMTEVSAIVPRERAGEVPTAFAALAQQHRRLRPHCSGISAANRNCGGVNESRW